MAHTSMLGTSLSTPGQIVPGLMIAGKATWVGPFPGVVQLPSGPAIVNPGDTLTLTPAGASQLLASDLTWWVLH